MLIERSAAGDLYLTSFAQCRNVLLSISGMENIQMIHSCDCNTAPMTEDDWEEADESPPNLPPITPRQKLFWVEYSKLAIIGKTPGSSLFQR